MFKIKNSRTQATRKETRPRKVINLSREGNSYCHVAWHPTSSRGPSGPENCTGNRFSFVIRNRGASDHPLPRPELPPARFPGSPPSGFTPCGTAALTRPDYTASSSAATVLMQEHTRPSFVQSKHFEKLCEQGCEMGSESQEASPGKLNKGVCLPRVGPEFAQSWINQSRRPGSPDPGRQTWKTGSEAPLSGKETQKFLSTCHMPGTLLCAPDTLPRVPKLRPERGPGAQGQPSRERSSRAQDTELTDRGLDAQAVRLQDPFRPPGRRGAMLHCDRAQGPRQGGREGKCAGTGGETHRPRAAQLGTDLTPTPWSAPPPTKAPVRKGCLRSDVWILFRSAGNTQQQL